MGEIISLKENRAFKRIYAKGKSYVAPNLVMYTMKNRVGFTRVGITTSKKIGKAVQRNRARRVIREAYRQINSNTNRNLDIVFVARGRTTKAKMQEVMKEMKYSMKKAGIIE